MKTLFILILCSPFAVVGSSPPSIDSLAKAKIRISYFMNTCTKPNIELVYQDPERPLAIYRIYGQSRCPGGGNYCGAGVEEGLLFLEYGGRNNNEIGRVEFQFINSCWKSIENRLIQNDSIIEIWNYSRKLFYFRKSSPVGFQTPNE
jgi:hypothetical protein